MLRDILGPQVGSWDVGLFVSLITHFVCPLPDVLHLHWLTPLQAEQILIIRKQKLIISLLPFINRENTVHMIICRRKKNAI